MREEDRILLLLGWGLMMMAIILLICKVTYQTDQLNKKIDAIAEDIHSMSDATTETTTEVIYIPEEPSDDEIVMEARPELLDDATPLEASMVDIATPSQAIEEPQKVVVTEVVEELTTEATPDVPIRSGLTAYAGVYNGPSGKETYYNLDMSRVVSIMRSMGYSEEDYPYWIRDDGVKMLGPYVMVAAELSTRPKGTILESSLGTAIVVDTGGFASGNPTQLDIATAW